MHMVKTHFLLKDVWTEPSLGLLEDNNFLQVVTIGNVAV